MEHHTHHIHEEHREAEEEKEEPRKETEEQTTEEAHHKKRKRRLPNIKKLFGWEWKNALVGFACGVLALNLFSVFYTVDVSVQPKWGKKTAATSNSSEKSGLSVDEQALAAEVLPADGFDIPVKWGDLGKKLIESGVIDEKKFTELYAQRGGVPQDMNALLTKGDIGSVRMTPENSSTLLNILWALGIGQKNTILEKGPMNDPEYGGAAGFASTGGWTLAKGDAMEHFSKHDYFKLNEEQQKRVEAVSQNVYRPCCGNSTFFPDCNHGMAMLGLLELMASQGMSEEDMYRIALQVNSYWFPDTYVTVAKYLKKRGVEWGSVDPKEVLGAGFSSAQGYKRILSEEQPVQQQGGGGCGV